MPKRHSTQGCGGYGARLLKRASAWAGHCLLAATLLSSVQAADFEATPGFHTSYDGGTQTYIATFPDENELILPGWVALTRQSGDTQVFGLQANIIGPVSYTIPQSVSLFSISSNSGPIIVNTSGDITFGGAPANPVGEIGTAAILVLGQPTGATPGSETGTVGANITVNHSGSLTVNGTGIAPLPQPPVSLTPSGFRTAQLSGIEAVSWGDQASGHSHTWAGGNVQITTDMGSSITMTQTDNAVITAGISAASAAGPGSGFGNDYGLNNVTVNHNGAIDVTAGSGAGIFATATGAQNNGSSAIGGQVGVYLSGDASIHVNDHAGETGGTGIGIFAVSEAYPLNSSSNGSDVSGGPVEVKLYDGADLSVGNSDSVLSVGVLAVSAGTDAFINPFSSQTVSKTGSGYGGDVTVDNAGFVTTRGKVSVGLAALSLGGAAQVTTVSGSNGDSSYVGSDGATDGGGGTVTVTNDANGQVATYGEGAHAIVAISSASGGLINNDLAAAGTEAPPGSPLSQLTGTWENSNTGLVLGNNSSGSAGHDGGAVTVDTYGIVTTGDGTVSSAASIGILAQSIGGGGGNAGGDHAALFVGDKGGKGGDGKLVTVNTYDGSTLNTYDVNSVGILAQSIGGGGGNGANAKGLFVAVGGRGGSGGIGGTVQIDHAGELTTIADHSTGIIAQSIGGGGGHGGAATAISPVFSVGIGGKGGSGGKGGEVDVTLESTGSITTTGNNSAGMHLQSVGGGGGTGGASMSDSAGPLAISIAVGGHGGTGGNGGVVNGTNHGTITTGVELTGPVGAPVIDGNDSYGIFAQSVGGGGGHGGSAIAKSLTTTLGEYPSIGIDLALGGYGGTAGGGSAVTLDSDGTVTTWGDGSHAVFAQSIGGGGGSGGDSTAMAAIIDAGVPEVPITIAHGGNGGGGGNGGDVTLSNSSGSATITTHGQNAIGLFAQTIGGGGGNGGVGNASAKTPNLGPDTTNIVVNLGLGGKAGGGGDAGFVNLTNDGTIQTAGSGSQGILAQAIGGGGGTSGGGSASGGNNSYEFDLAIGATGGSGGSASNSSENDNYSVQVTNNGGITTTAGESIGIHAQSIGGGGGNGGTADVEATTGPIANLTNFINPSTTYSSIIGVGGKGGTGGQGGAVKVDNTEDSAITTSGIRSHGIFAQSISGGGGMGGSANATSNSAVIDPFTYQDPDPENPDDPPQRNNNYSINASVGGAGGNTHTGGAVNLSNEGSVATSGYSAQGIFAQSIGGGGGVAADGSLDTQTTLSLGVRINGSSGESGSGGAITIANTGSITTAHNDAYGIFAQSIGGGGGLATSGTDIPFTVSPTFGIYPNMHVGLNLGIDIDNHDAIDGGTVAITNGGATTGQGVIHTDGDLSMGIVAQSVGGGGGKAGTVFGTNSIALPEFDVQLGAKKGYGNGNTVSVTLNSSTDIKTGNGGDGRGFAAYGIVAQSIGGGGGLVTDGSSAATGSMNLGGQSKDATGDGNTVTLTGTGSVTTQGDSAHGVILQSVGGGGGIAVTGSSRTYQGSETPDGPDLTLGGQNSYGHGGTVNLTNAQLNVATSGDNAFGVILQSVGGGGGIATSKQTGGTATLGRTASDQDQEAGGEINATFAAGSSVTTTGAGSHAIVVQSIGGGGGIVNPESPDGTNINVFTQENSAHGYGGETHLTVNGTVTTTGTGANGILAQVIGGGGGLNGSWAGSTGGSNSSTDGTKNGSLTITQSGTVNATGDHSIGIFAQNVAGGGSAGNDISITVNGDVSGTQNGIRVDGGKSNHIQVNGSVSGGILYSTGISLNVTNAGEVSGSVGLNGDAVGTFTNEDTGLFNTGSNIVATVDDSGTLLIGGDGAVIDTFMSGHYTQNANALIQFDVLSGTEFDQFTFADGGHGTFGGTMYVLVENNGWDLTVGTYTLISAAAGSTANTFDSNFLGNMFLYGLGDGVEAELVHNTSNQSIQMVVTAIPEPSTWCLLVIGAVGLFIFRRLRFA